MRVAVAAGLGVFACAVQATPVTPAALCQQEAAKYSADLTGIAAEQNTTASDITAQFVAACASQINADMQQTETALLGIQFADAGTAEEKLK